MFCIYLINYKSHKYLRYKERESKIQDIEREKTLSRTILTQGVCHKMFCFQHNLVCEECFLGENMLASKRYTYYGLNQSYEI